MNDPSARDDRHGRPVGAPRTVDRQRTANGGAAPAQEPLAAREPDSARQADERLPDFLIIGAMKAGTTTLYRDLMTHPRIFFPLDKEPNNLCDDAVLSPRGRNNYAAHFRRARPDQLCAEASTAYTKIPVHTGAPERARSLIGPHLKAIYLIRDPVARIVSQHHHELTVGRLRVIPDINEAVRRTPRYLDYSRYAMQARPWLDAFGPDNIRFVLFERYIQDRCATVAELERFLALDPRPDLVENDRAFNTADARPGRAGRFAAVSKLGLYKRFVRPLLSQEARDRLRRLFYRKPPPRPAPPTPQTVEFILDNLRDDMRSTARLVAAQQGDPEPTPLWDEDAIRARYAGAPASPAPDRTPAPPRT